MKDIPDEVCPWSLSGPQFPQPTAIQQRYCYPKGSADYSSRKGGALWTMYGPEGRENLDYRLLHVYFSAKRAVNKGISASEVEHEQAKRKRDDTSVASKSVSSQSTGKKKRKMNYVANDRAVRSPWQDPKRYNPRGSAASAPAKCLSPRRYVFGNPGLLPPHSPFTMKKPYVSPTGGSTETSIDRQPSNDEGSSFSKLPFHDVGSFDGNDGDMITGQGVGRNPHGVFRPQGDDTSARIQHLLGSNSFEESLLQLEQAWHHDPLFAIGLTRSDEVEESDVSYINDASRNLEQPDSSELLAQRLESLQVKIRNGILAHPPEEQGRLVSVVANWARCLAQSPLGPLPLLQPDTNIKQEEGMEFKTYDEMSIKTENFEAV